MRKKCDGNALHRVVRRIHRITLQLEVKSQHSPLRCFAWEAETRSQTLMICMDSPEQIRLVRLLLARLERVSVDSYWAHRASGIRGSLLRVLEKIEAGEAVDNSDLKRLVTGGFQILERAARERTR